MARSLPASLSGVTVQKLHVWPKQFDELLPTNDDIGFYFLPESERFKEAYNSLLADLGSKDYALKFVIGNAELLVFSSLELQLESQMESPTGIQGKFYIWGLFRRKKVNSSLVDGSFPREQGNLRGIQHSDSAAAVDAGKERNYTEDDEEGATDIVEIAEASQKLNERQRSHIKKKACPINPSTSLTGEAFVEDSASAGSGTSWQVREVLNQCTSMTTMKKRMEEQSRDGRQVSGVFRKVNNGATIKEIKSTRKPDYIAEKERDRGTHKGTIAEKSTEITTSACAINRKETTKHGKGVLEIESHGIEGRPSDATSVPQGPAEAIDQEVSMVPSSMMHEDITQKYVAYEKEKYPIEADCLGNENMHMVDDVDRFIDELVNIHKAHQAVALQSAPPSFSISAAPDLQAPDVNLREENKKADASHELVTSDKINHSGDEHVGPYLVHSHAATILRSIFNQYGDIAQDCPLSIRTRSRLLEGLCLELKKVLSIVPEDLQHHHLESLDSVIGEAESEQLNVKWLRDWHAKLKKVVALHQHYEKIKRDLAKVDESPMTLHPESPILMNLKYDIQLLRSESIVLEEEMRDRGTITSPVLEYASKLKRFCDRILAKVTNVV
ncbi:Phospholipase-like protein [Corchorus olitorius]|uniref:Phospholipase-like protein n=1 Tax=Corchorus olitorius TaxID=93759 RepID=A0A1R3H539_9ROSI|nr:Phospholipase-like protein [Corchorus olitorius]